MQALGQTCSQLRRLVQDDIPGSSWLRSAELSFPRGHPLFKLPAQRIPHELSRLAALHRAVSKGQPAAVLRHEVWQGSSANPCASAFNQAGNLLLEKRSGDLVLSSLVEQGTRLVQQELWRVPAPAHPNTWWHLQASFAFSPDDSRVAIVFTPYDDSYQSNLNIEAEQGETVWDLLFVLDLSARTLHDVTHTPEFHDLSDLLLMQEGLFSPNSSLLLVPWVAFVDNAAAARIEIFRCADYQRLCLVEFGDFGAEIHRSAFSPDSLHFATAWPGQFHIHSVQGTLARVQVVVGHDALEDSQDHAQLIDWSVCGSHLAYWSSGLECIYLYDVSTWLLLATVRLPTISVACSGMDFGLSALVHASWSRDKLVVAVVSLSHLPDGQLDLVAMTRFAHFADMPVHPLGEELDTPAWCNGAWACMSPDGCFAAVSGPGCRVAVYTSQTRTRVFYQEFEAPEFELQPVAVLQHVVQMDWVQGGGALLVHCNAESYHLEAPDGRLRTEFHDWVILIKFLA